MITANTIMNSIKTIAAESEDLEVHVELCAQRYNELDGRLKRLDQKMDQLTNQVAQFTSDFKKTLIVTGGTIIVAIISTLSVILTKI